MFKYVSFVVLMALSLHLSAQENVFLGRDYWKSTTDLTQVKADIKKGNDPAESNYYGFDGTTYAILGDAPQETIEYMISLKGNGANKLTHDGRTYIFWAAYKNNFEVVKYLIKKGAKTDVLDAHGYTISTFAANAGVTNKDMFTYLHKNGADITRPNLHGATVLLVAMPRLKDFSFISYLTDNGLELGATDEDGNGAFNYAASGGNIALMDKLIEMGIEYKGLNHKGGNAMLSAARVNRRGPSAGLEVFKYLEAKGIDPNIKDKTGTTPLHQLAGRSEDIAVLEYFIKKGVATNSADEKGNTPFMLAAESNNLQVIKLMQTASTNINATNKAGDHALNLALAHNTPEVVDYLISQGADPNANSGKMLVNGYRKGNVDAFAAKLKAIESLGYQPSITDADKNTLVHLAIEKGEVAIIDILLTYNVPVNTKNAEGYTPLHIAAMKSQDTAILELLAKAGADKNARTDFDETAYDLASENELLSKSNADLSFLKS